MPRHLYSIQPMRTSSILNLLTHILIELLLGAFNFLFALDLHNSWCKHTRINMAFYIYREIKQFFCKFLLCTVNLVSIWLPLDKTVMCGSCAFQPTITFELSLVFNLLFSLYMVLILLQIYAWSTRRAE